MSPTAARRPSRRAKSKAVAPTTPARPFVAHHLAPLHEVLGEEETKKVLAELQTAPERLPRILVTDPGLRTDPRHEGLKGSGENLVGRLVRIRRPSSTAGEAIAYRLIVQALGGD